ncbi:MAG: lysine--tRNA ligase [Chitinivibrionales bacterium]|nr:lysine--tRNA ligase [Chitinivibrionales bacterium]
MEFSFVENQEPINDQMQARIDKIKDLRLLYNNAYAERFERTHNCAIAKALEDGHKPVLVAGRVMSIRQFGKLIFGHLQDFHGRIQFAAQKDVLREKFDPLKKLVDVGDFIGIEGEMITTKKGEKSINVLKWKFLSKSLRPLPEKFHGLTDPEQRLRRRYLDMAMSPEVLHRFKKRTKIVAAIRNYLNNNGFYEIETPILQNKASGALATPFVTHYNALDMDVYMRIAPETYLKRAIAGGFEKVYEFARSFRNEGVDSSHLPDFTLLEYYVAYWNYEDNMVFTERLIKHLLMEVNGSVVVKYGDTEINFETSWPRISFRDLILQDTGVDIYECPNKEKLLEAIKSEGIDLSEEVDLKKAGRGTIIDQLYKKMSRPDLIDPVFVIHHPLDLSPLARRNDENPRVVDRFQLVVNGWEVVNAYSELVDPLDQAERFKQQAEIRAEGESEAMVGEDDFLTCMEYGMPPMSGWGMGIDRIVALLTNANTLRDVVLFPLLRPE